MTPAGLDLAGMSGGLLVAAAAGTAMLALGVAHYAGRLRWMAQVWVISPYLVLAMAWLGAGAVLSVAGLVLMAQDVAVLVLLGALLVVAAHVSWLVGVVGIFWLPRRLRPRWLEEQVAEDPGQMRTPRSRRVRERRTGRA